MVAPSRVWVSAARAEKMLVHKVDPDACLHLPMAARVTGTVVVVIEIDKHGDVIHQTVVSGPAILRKPVLDAVRRYKYKPYLLNTEPIGMKTTVSVVIDSLRGCPGE